LPTRKVILTYSKFFSVTCGQYQRVTFLFNIKISQLNFMKSSQIIKVEQLQLFAKRGKGAVKMLSARDNENKKEEISGLALALLFGRCFIDLFDFYEYNKKPPRRLRTGKSLLAKKQTTRVAKRNVFLRRY
jgi:hypothetical protein